MRIERGPQPFQIVQQDEGFESFHLEGRFLNPGRRGMVQVRIVREEDGVAVRDWENAGEQQVGSWSHSIERIPAGELYRIESRLVMDEDFVVEEGGAQIAIRKAECVARDRARLTLERPVSTATRVHGAFGANPPASLRDAELNVPMLGFYGLPLGD